MNFFALRRKDAKLSKCGDEVMSYRYVLIFLLIAMPRVYAEKQSVTHYKLYSKGLPVGRVETTRAQIETNGESFVRCEVATDVKLNLLVFGYEMHAREVSLSGTNGVVEYQKTMEEDGKKKEIRGSLRDDVFTFSVPKPITVARADYDYTSLDNPEILLDLKEKRSFKVLDLATGEVVQRTFEWIEEEKIGDVLCRVIEIMDRNNWIKRWIAIDDLGVVIVRQDGREKAGAYSMRMIE